MAKNAIDAASVLPPPASVIPALDRPKGVFSVDSNGLAKYQFQLELPPGIGEGNTPILSFCYGQGQGNGLLGTGWQLAGLSSIQRAPRNLAIDGLNAHVTYNLDGTRLAVDGMPLILSSGAYGQPSATYNTEINSGTIISTTGSGLQLGFLATDNSGRTLEYGTSEDSRALSNDGTSIREWHLKANYDLYGNRMVYNYTTTPNLLSGLATKDNRGITYLTSIIYTTNDRDNGKAVANRRVDFLYSSREDPVVVCGAGDVLVMAYRLSRIGMAVTAGPSMSEGWYQARAYNLGYEVSPTNGTSRIISITEEGADGLSLPATLVDYNPSIEAGSPFQQAATPMTLVGEQRSTIRGLLPMNITGHGLADLCLISLDNEADIISLKCFLAQIESVDADGNNLVTWTLPTSSDGQADLPPIANGSKPAFIPTDLSRDGKTDFVMAYDSGSGLKFSLSRCTGTGFAPYAVYDTSCDWNDGDRFFPIDCDGNGHVDIVQVTALGGYITLRSYFSSIDADGNYTIGSVQELQTVVSAANTLRWFPADVTGDGLQDLVRVWHDEDSNGLMEVFVSTYRSNAQLDGKATFTEGVTNQLGTYTSEALKSLNVLACDMNADGIQDIVFCQIEQTNDSDTELTFNFGTFLCDGAGGFTLDSTQRLSHTVPGQTTPIDGNFEIQNLDGTGRPSIVYRFQDYLRNQIALVAQGNYSTQITGFSSCVLFNQAATTTLNQPSLISADINGSGKAGWFAWSSGNGVASVITTYNIQALGESLSSITDPLGLCTEPTYRPISQPNIYRPAPGLEENQAPSNSVSVLGNARYVVSQYRQSNIESQNALEVRQLTQMFYEGARLDLRGHGWQGFRKIYTKTDEEATCTVETYLQDFPMAMHKVQEDTYALPNAQTNAEFPVLNADQLLRSKLIQFQPQNKTVQGGTTYFINKVLEQVNMYDAGSCSHISGTSTTGYDDNGLPTMTTTYLGDPLSPEAQYFQQGTRTVYGSTVARNLPLSQKTSTVAGNLNEMTNFLPGDISLSHFSYDETSFYLTQRLDWSIYHNKFLAYNFTSDTYGNLTSSSNPVGLTEDITYDSWFHTYPVRVIRSGTGLSQPLERLYAYDPRFGVEVSSTAYNRMVTYSSLDAFGRETAQMTPSVPVPNKPPPNWLSPILAATDDLANVLKVQVMTTTKQTNYTSFCDSGRTWLGRSVVRFAIPESLESAEIFTEYVDCNGRPQRSISQQGTSSALWVYRGFNVSGTLAYESIPTVPSGWALAEKLMTTVPKEMCRTIVFDSLQRPIAQIEPLPIPGGSQLSTTTVITNGGTTLTVQEGIVGGDIISSTTLDLQMIAGQPKLVSKMDDLGQVTTYDYDAAGNLFLATDPGGQEDWSSYDLQGLLLSTNNPYQNRNLTGTNKALVYEYDEGKRPIRETNAAGETTTYQYDAMNRRTSRSGLDGRTITYTYDGTPNGLGNITSATVSQPGVADIESTCRFDYDERGKPIASYLDLNIRGETPLHYEVGYTYDLQGQMVSKTLPDRTVLTITRSGTQVTSSSMSFSDPTIPAWNLVADFTAFDPYGHYTEWNLKGSGAISPEFYGTAQYDANGKPLLRALRSGSSSSSPLVQEQYVSDTLGRIVQCSEVVSGDSVQYSYVAKRLSTSKTTDGETIKFDYDNSGNLLAKNGVQFSYLSTRVSGTKNSEEVFAVNYDACGRMSSRTNNSKTFTFQYDGFGKTSVVIDQQSEQTSNFYTDFLGRTLVQVRSNGSKKVRVSPDYIVSIEPDGSEIIDKYLYGPNAVLARVTTIKAVEQPEITLGVIFTNNKGNVTHVFDNTGQPQQKFTYDEFGMLTSAPNARADLTATYESQSMYADTGLLDFGARDYDPVLGRFTTPDNQWSNDPLAACDVMNRYAFENNDPINNTDPTGHWTSWSIATLVVAIVVVVAVVAFNIATAGMFLGVQALVVGALAGGLMGAGTSAIGYAIQHQDQGGEDFAKGLAVNVSIGFASGFVTGLAGTAFSMLKGMGGTGLALSTARGPKIAWGPPANTFSFAKPWASLRTFAGNYFTKTNLLQTGAKAGVKGALGAGSFAASHFGIHPALDKALADDSAPESNDQYARAGSNSGPQAMSNSAYTAGSASWDWTAMVADASSLVQAALQMDDVQSAALQNIQ